MFVSVAVALSGAVLFWKRSSRRVGTPPQRATYEALHTASVAASALRGGLTADTAIKAAPALRQLLGTPVVAIANQTGLVSCEGSDRHAHALNRRLQDVLSSGRPQLLSAADLCCGHGGDCPMRAGVAVPVAVDGAVIGATLAEELRFVDIYLELERARFGDRLAVSLRVAPEVLPVRVPSLVLQPLVENAVRHGLEQLSGTARLQISAEDGGHEAVVTVEDHGVGTDPEQLADVLAGRRGGQSIGLRNVDERLRATFGNDHGLTIETGVGAGTKVTMHLPKFCPAVSGP